MVNNQLSMIYLSAVPGCDGSENVIRGQSSGEVRSPDGIGDDYPSNVLCVNRIQVPADKVSTCYNIDRLNNKYVYLDFIITKNSRGYFKR